MRYGRARWAMLCGAGALYAAGAFAQAGPPTASLPLAPEAGASATASAASSARPPAPAQPGASAAPSAPPPASARPAAPAPPGSSARVRSAPPSAPRLGPPPRPPPGYAAPRAAPYPYYGYPYGYAYPYAYSYPPRPPPKPVYPKHAASRESPFFDGLAGGVLLGQRVSAPACFGGEAGVFLAARVRIAARILFNLSEAKDANTQALGSSSWEINPSSSATFEWGGSLGYAVVSTSEIVFSPGVTFLRTDRSEYGNFLGASFPLTWVHSNGLRIGLDVAFGEAFGGTLLETCYASSGTPCSIGQVRRIDRESSAGLYGAFTIGFGFNHPEPIDVKRQALSRAQP